MGPWRLLAVACTECFVYGCAEVGLGLAGGCLAELLAEQCLEWLGAVRKGGQPSSRHQYHPEIVTS